MTNQEYWQAAIDFLSNWLYPFAPVIPELPEPLYFPWDVFCAANPGLLQTLANFEQVTGYELSEWQCSWACMKYRAEVRSWWS